LSKKRSGTLLMPAIERTANYDSVGVHIHQRIKALLEHRLGLLGHSGEVKGDVYLYLCCEESSPLRARFRVVSTLKTMVENLEGVVRL
jgi:hypothetical protein